MPLDRKQPEYRAVEILLDEDLRTMLDRAVDGSATTTGLKERILATGAGHSTQARLRLAMWFWNGSIDIDKGDVLTLDLENRARFVVALEQHLGLAVVGEA